MIPWVVGFLGGGWQGFVIACVAIAVFWAAVLIAAQVIGHFRRD